MFSIFNNGRRDAEKVVLEYDGDKAFTRNFATNEIIPVFDGDNLNMKTGGFKDFFVSTAIKAAIIMKINTGRNIERIYTKNT